MQEQGTAVSIDSRLFRDSLGLFSTGVCLVAVTDGAGVAHAITVNSFASVSLDPPLVLWSLQNGSDVYGLYAQAPEYSIAILTAAQEPLSTRYAQKGHHELDREHFDVGANGAPLIRGALVNMECSLDAAVPGGDHRILIGRVSRIVPGEAAAPLLFFDGAYRQIL